MSKSRTFITRPPITRPRTALGKSLCPTQGITARLPSADRASNAHIPQKLDIQDPSPDPNRTLDTENLDFAAATHPLEEQGPDECVPEEFIPEECVPEECVPEECVPEECVPEELVSEDLGSAETGVVLDKFGPDEFGLKEWATNFSESVSLQLENQLVLGFGDVPRQRSMQKPIQRPLQSNALEEKCSAEDVPPQFEQHFVLTDSPSPLLLGFNNMPIPDIPPLEHVEQATAVSTPMQDIDIPPSLAKKQFSVSDDGESHAQFQDTQQNMPDRSTLIHSMQSLKMVVEVMQSIVSPQPDIQASIQPEIPANMIGQQSTQVEYWLKQSLILLRKQYYTEALVACDRALTYAPNFPKIWNCRGQILSQQQHYSEALQAYQVATALDINFVAAWFNQGVALKNLNRRTEAIVAYECALGLYPRFSEAWFQRGQLLQQLRQYDEAISSYKTAMHVDHYWGNANVCQTWYHQANCYLALNQLREALSAYDQVLQLNSDQNIQQERLQVLKRIGQQEINKVQVPDK